jgi:2-iminobutanoate/2-iminopropanoate deaminase
MSGIKYVVDVPGYPPSHSPYSHAVVANGFVFVSGQAAVRPGGSALEIVGTTMQEQTRQALRNVESVLKAAGSSLDKVVKVTVLLARPDLFKEMNEAYAEFFPKNKPARAAAQLGAAIPGLLISIEAVAVLEGLAHLCPVPVEDAAPVHTRRCRGRGQPTAGHGESAGKTA